jgi:DNA-binding response OmpR family regulator
MQLKQKCRILYIEDHQDTLELVLFALKANEYDVVHDRTITGALELVRTSNFDLYLLDNMLPDGSGIDLCRRIREVDDTTPIVFFSAAAYSSDKQTAFNAGAQDYIVKPANLTELCDVIARLVEPGPQSRPDQISLPPQMSDG